MSTTNEAEIKLLTIKCRLLSEISTLESQLSYHVKNGAEECLRLIRKKFEGGGFQDTLELSKEEYTVILKYLECVQKDAMHLWKNNAYLKTYYEQIFIKNDVLKQL